MGHAIVECWQSALALVDLLDGVEYAVIPRSFVLALELLLNLEPCDNEVKRIRDELRDSRS
jgi:hypothetical protein